MTTNYNRGANFEREVRKHLQKQGYPCWRVAGSKREGSVNQAKNFEQAKTR